MNLEYSIEQTIRMRSSIRSYQNRPLSAEDKQKVLSYIGTITNPFGMAIGFHYAETAAAKGGEKAGTYGVIKGASSYIGASVADQPLALEALGYSFEKLVLYAASIGLGTCWLGGTFARSKFASVMKVPKNHILPIISPIGYPAQKRSLVDKLFRGMAGSDHRKEWNELFFDANFSVPLSHANAGDYAFALEMLRLAPSASNQQPWRVIHKDNAYHFYMAKTAQYESKLGFDIQRIDLGIAACHFHLAALERNLPGHFKMTDPGIHTIDNVSYSFSWVAE